jgi:hypothetical protein
MLINFKVSKSIMKNKLQPNARFTQPLKLLKGVIKFHKSL